MNLLSLFSGVIKPVFDSIFKWKSESNKMELSRQEFELMKKQLQSDIEVRMAEEMRKPEPVEDFHLSDREIEVLENLSRLPVTGSRKA